MAEFQCLHCGGPFFAPPSRKGKYCGVPCLRAANPTKRHGWSETREYDSWFDMRDRCRNPRHHAWDRYGGRGIIVCDRWKDSFENFIEDMGPRPAKSYSIERIDNDGNYEPSNCKWATKTEQSRNRSGVYTLEQDAKIRELVGLGLNFTEVAKALGKPKGSVSNRAYRIGLKSGQPPHPKQRYPSRAVSEGASQP